MKIERTRPEGNKPARYTAQPGETIVHVAKKLTGGALVVTGNPARNVGGRMFEIVGGILTEVKR